MAIGELRLDDVDRHRAAVVPDTASVRNIQTNELFEGFAVAVHGHLHSHAANGGNLLVFGAGEVLELVGVEGERFLAAHLAHIVGGGGSEAEREGGRACAGACGHPCVRVVVTHAGEGHAERRNLAGGASGVDFGHDNCVILVSLDAGLVDNLEAGEREQSTDKEVRAGHGVDGLEAKVNAIGVGVLDERHGGGSGRTANGNHGEQRQVNLRCASVFAEVVLGVDFLRFLARDKVGETTSGNLSHHGAKRLQLYPITCKKPLIL